TCDREAARAQCRQCCRAVAASRRSHSAQQIQRSEPGAVHIDLHDAEPIAPEIQKTSNYFGRRGAVNSWRGGKHLPALADIGGRRRYRRFEGMARRDDKPGNDMHERGRIEFGFRDIIKTDLEIDHEPEFPQESWIFSKRADHLMEIKL